MCLCKDRQCTEVDVPKRYILCRVNVPKSYTYVPNWSLTCTEVVLVKVHITAATPNGLKTDWSVELVLLCSFRPFRWWETCSGTEYWISRKWTQTELAAVKCTSTVVLYRSGPPSVPKWLCTELVLPHIDIRLAVAISRSASPSRGKTLKMLVILTCHRWVLYKGKCK